LSDLIRVHPELRETVIEQSLEIATAEIILVEITEEDEKSTVCSRSDGSDSKVGSAFELSKTSTGYNIVYDRYFEFSHDSWRTNLLTTMLKERRIELHRLIAEAMQRDKQSIIKQNDIGKLLTLFDHWKKCGNFCMAAPLALAVGTRLEEWDLACQSLELYNDALDMCYDKIMPVEEKDWRSDGRFSHVSY